MNNNNKLNFININILNNKIDYLFNYYRYVHFKKKYIYNHLINNQLYNLKLNNNINNKNSNIHPHPLNYFLKSHQIKHFQEFLIPLKGYILKEIKKGFKIIIPSFDNYVLNYHFYISFFLPYSQYKKFKRKYEHYKNEVMSLLKFKLSSNQLISIRNYLLQNKNSLIKKDNLLNFSVLTNKFTIKQIYFREGNKRFKIKKKKSSCGNSFVLGHFKNTKIRSLKITSSKFYNKKFFYYDH